MNKSSGRKKRRFYQIICICGVFTAVLCILSQFSIPLQPVPFTFSLFAIFITGALLPVRWAFLSVLTYILLGAVGLPVFAGFRGGVSSLVGMTGGYLISYPFMVLIIALTIKLFRRKSPVSSVAGMLLSLIFCYILGTAWYGFVAGVSFVSGLTVCVLPFIAFDIAKAVFAAMLVSPLSRILQKHFL